MKPGPREAGGMSSVASLSVSSERVRDRVSTVAGVDAEGEDMLMMCDLKFLLNDSISMDGAVEKVSQRPLYI